MAERAKVTRHYRSSAARAGWALAALAGIALFAALGAWQWSRATWKQALLAERAAVLERRVVQPWPVAFDASRRGQLDWIAGRGRFDGRVLFLDNQQRGGRAGVRVYRVLQPDGEAGPVLVELGWLPWGARRELPAVDIAANALVDVAGVLAPPPSTGLPLGAGYQSLGAGRYLLTRLDPVAQAAGLGLSVPLAPRVLKLDPALPIGYERDFDLLPNTLPPERHRGYAVQWWGLSATVAIVYTLLTVRAARRRKTAP